MNALFALPESFNSVYKPFIFSNNTAKSRLGEFRARGPRANCTFVMDFTYRSQKLARLRSPMPSWASLVKNVSMNSPRSHSETISLACGDTPPHWAAVEGSHGFPHQSTDTSRSCSKMAGVLP